MRYGFVRQWPWWKDVLMGLLLIAFTVALAAWAAPARANSDIECTASYADKSLDSIRGKMPFTARPTFAMLVDKEKPNDEQQLALIELDKKKIACANALVKELADVPPAELSLFTRAVTLEQAARADLYLGKMTFGEYNKTVQKIGLDTDAGLVELDKAQPVGGADRSAIARGAAAGARQALPVYNPFPKPLICTSTRRGTLVDTYCR